MSIFPAVDLVVDVAQAADPQKRNAVVARLAELSGTRAPAEDFGSLVAARPSRSSEATAHMPQKTPMTTSAAPFAVGSPKPTSASAAAEKFEAFVIQSCLETILPKAEDGLFGHGAAGNAWRSMLAEQIGAQIAKAGGLGLKAMLVADLDRRSDGDATARRRETAT
jgi:hypothetical protein